MFSAYESNQLELGAGFWRNHIVTWMIDETE